MALDDDVKNLARNAAFSEMEPEALRFLAFSAETRILRAGDILFRRGDIADSGYIVLTGSIALILEDGATAERIITPPNLIGDIALITETQRPATAIAREPSSVLKISRTLFHRILNEFPSSAVRLHAQISKKLNDFVDELSRAEGLKG